MKLLSTANTKTMKGEAYGYRTYIMHLAPHMLSGINTCPHASPGCIATCLNTAGMGKFSNVQQARIAKTKFLFENRSGFLEMLRKEINSAIRSSSKHGLKPCFRLNGTSDINWSSVNLLGDFLNTAQFYDYTKNVSMLMNNPFPDKYHLTYSRHELSTPTDLDKVINSGFNVAVVFRKKPYPVTYLGLEVIDGDVSDLRFLDKKGPCVVGLLAKGKAKHDTTGFVVDV